MDLRFLLVPAALAVLMLAGCPQDGPTHDPNNPGNSPTVEEGSEAVETE